MGWEYLIVFIISYAVSYAMAPKPEIPPPASLTDMQVPTAEPGRPIPVVFGTRIVSSPNVVWYGDFKYVAVMSAGGGK